MSDGITRRAALAGGGAAAFGAGALLAPEAAMASSSPLFVVVDASGGGDYTDLEAAIANVPADSTIFVRRGTYTIQNGDMNPAPGVRVVGEGYGTHVRAKDHLDTNVFFIRNDNVVIEHLRVDGNGVNQIYASGNNIRYEGCDGGKVLSCFVHDSPGYNIVAFPGCKHILISGNQSYDSLEEGIEIQGSSYCTVVGNSVYGNLKNGILLWSSTDDAANNTVVGNVVRNCQGFGVLVQDRAHDSTVVGNTITGSGLYGISVNDGCSAIVVEGNVVDRNGKGGIQLDRVKSCAITRNVSKANALTGIMVNVVDDCIVKSNVVSGNGAHGIRVETQPSEPLRGAAVTGNVCFDNGKTTAGQAGISLFGPVNGVAVNGNRCYDTQAAPTQAYGAAASERSAPSPKSQNLLFGENLLEGNKTSGLNIASDVPSAHTIAYRRLTATVGSSQVGVPHGLPYTPRSVQITETSTGQVWKSAASDAKNIYLRANGPNRTVEVLVG